MTRKELEKMMGSADKADWMMEQLLASVKPGMIMTILKLKKEAQERKVKERTESGYYAEGEAARKEIPEGWSLFGDESDPEWQENNRKYELWDSRSREQEADRQTLNFFSNTYCHALWNLPEPIPAERG